MQKSQFIFDPDFDVSSFRLLVLNDEIEREIKEGQKLLFKGEDTGQCILSTTTKSFALEKIETSNTLLLCREDENDSYSIKGTVGMYLELMNNPVDINKILSHIPSLDVRETDHDDQITLRDLESRCLFSFGEIQKVVQDYPYIVQDENGHLYKVTSQFYYQHLVDFVQHCILKSINLHHFSLEEVLRVDMGIHPLFIKHLVGCLLGSEETLQSQVLSIPRSSLVYNLARAAFLCENGEAASLQTGDQLESRISRWLPKGYDFDIGEDAPMLHGIAIREKEKGVQRFRFIDKDILELDPRRRFLQLFEIESEWTQEDLVPFISDLTNYGFGLPGDLLLKYCREVTFDTNGDAKKYYVLRH